jgi:hypothetical protein
MDRFLTSRIHLSVLLALACSASLVLPAHAEMEKIAIICDNGICPHWWPKLAVPAGWQHDEDASVDNNINALAPEGESFDDAVTVMYANAVYKPRVPELKTLAAFVAEDQAGLLKKWPDTSITHASALHTRDGKTAESWQIEPQADGSWERVAYLEEGEYYLVFVASTQTPEGLKKVMPTFESLVEDYKE